MSLAVGCAGWTVSRCGWRNRGLLARDGATARVRVPACLATVKEDTGRQSRFRSIEPAIHCRKTKNCSSGCVHVENCSTLPTEGGSGLRQAVAEPGVFPLSPQSGRLIGACAVAPVFRRECATHVSARCHERDARWRDGHRHGRRRRARRGRPAFAAVSECAPGHTGSSRRGPGQLLRRTVPGAI